MSRLRPHLSLIALGAFLLPASAMAAPSMSVSGVCPGVVDISVTGATPNKNVVFLTGTLGGSTTLAAGGCAGTDIDLGGITLRFNGKTNGAGAKTLSPNLAAGACATGGQWLDLTTCEVSEALALGPSCTVPSTDWTDTPPVAGPPFEADPTFFAMWTETSVASGLREDFEIEDPAGNIPIPATLVVDFLDATFATQCSVYLDISAATVDNTYTASSIDPVTGAVAVAVTPVDPIFVTVGGGFTDCLELDPAGALAVALGSTDIRNFVWGDWGMAFNETSAELEAAITAAVGAATYAADWDPFITGESFFGLETNWTDSFDRTCEVVEVDPVSGLFTQLPKPVGPFAEHEVSGAYWVFSL